MIDLDGNENYYDRRYERYLGTRVMTDSFKTRRKLLVAFTTKETFQERVRHGVYHLKIKHYNIIKRFCYCKELNVKLL